MICIWKKNLVPYHWMESEWWYIGQSW